MAMVAEEGSTGLDTGLICRKIERLIEKNRLTRNVLMAGTLVVVPAVSLLTNHWYFLWHIPLFCTLIFLLTFMREHKFKQGLDVVRKASPTAHKIHLILNNKLEIKLAELDSIWRYMHWYAHVSDPPIGFAVWISGFMRQEQAAVMSGSTVHIYASNHPGEPVVIITRTGILVGERESDEPELSY